MGGRGKIFAAGFSTKDAFLEALGRKYCFLRHITPLSEMAVVGGGGAYFTTMAYFW